MPDMTEEEYDSLDELWTETTLKIGPNGTGFISRRNARLFGLDDFSMDYLMAKSMADNKIPRRKQRGISFSRGIGLGFNTQHT